MRLTALILFTAVVSPSAQTPNADDVIWHREVEIMARCRVVSQSA